MQVSGEAVVCNMHMQIMSTDKVDNLQLYLDRFCRVLEFLSDCFDCLLFSPIIFFGI